MTAGQYGFTKDFAIVDRRTATARTPDTMSGGETFLASLALALGLVELAGRSGGRLQALFLDEGFGSLDPDALDQALTELERRADTGRLIAIVSHVSAIAERIDQVLQVTKTPRRSEVQAAHRSATRRVAAGRRHRADHVRRVGTRMPTADLIESRLPAARRAQPRLARQAWRC